MGTRVRDSRYDVSIANTTASASGVNRNFATPVSSTTGKNTMQIESVPTKVGVAICDGAVENRGQQRLVHRVVAMDIFDLDRGVIDQHPDRERDSAERHRVDRLAGQLERDDRGQNRQRDRRDDDQHAARRAEEHQHHQRDQRGGDRGLLHDVPQGGAHELRLIEGERDLQSLGRGGADERNLGLDRVDHGQRRGVGVLDHHQVGRLLAVDAHHVGLRLMSVGHRRDIAQEDRRAVDVP